MTRPLVIAHHLIFTAYGFWLPNDPRGSMSHIVRNDIIEELGELHHGRKMFQPSPAEVRTFLRKAGETLLHPQLEFNSSDITQISESLSETIASTRYTCWACAIMPDHVHLVMRKHRDKAEHMIEAFQDASRKKLHNAGARLHPHPVWGGPGWRVFLEHPDDVRRTIKYVEDNPVKIGRARQQWPFVKEYDGWPLHAGHSKESPYVRALRAAGRYP